MKIPTIFKMNVLLMLFTVSLLASETLSQDLKSVSDEDLLQLVKTKEFLVVLFSKHNSEICKKYEAELQNLNEDLIKNLKISSVTAYNSHLVRLYSPTKEPALVFFRHGVPLLYSGEADEAEIYPFLENNKQPLVKELSDATFEHITQAASGATTGDWLLMFYSAKCVDCQRLQAIWEGVGAVLKVYGRVNVARIDESGAGALTAKRFKVNSVPTFILLRHGKYYKYDLPKYDIKSFVSFAQDWYKNARGENVPTLESPFDELLNFSVDLVRKCITFGVDILVENPWIWQIGILGFGLVLLTATIALMKAGKSKPSTEGKKKSK